MSKQNGMKYAKNFLKALSIFLVVFMTVTFCGCAKEQKPNEAIKADPVNYYLYKVYPGSFTYPDSDQRVSMKTNDRSFIQFASGFKSMVMGFDSGTGTYKYLYFVVTSSSLKDNNIKATVERIYKGEIIRFTVTSDTKYIYFQSDVTYTLLTDSEENNGEVVVKRNMTVLIYHRTAPGYI